MSGRSEHRRGSSIKPFRSQIRMDDTQAIKILDDLKYAIHEIHDQNASALSFEELYRKAYNLVLHKHGEKLYKGIETEVTEYLAKLGNQVAIAGDETLLNELVEKWRTHTTTMRMIRDILMYMDRTFVVQEKKEAVYDLGLRIFREQVARHKNVRGRVLKVLLSNIEQERKGELIDRVVIRNVLQMLVDLGIDSLAVYETDFERQFLEITKSFYQQEAMEYMQMNTCPDYVIKAEKRLEEERLRAQTYLHYSTEEKLLRIVADEMVVAHAGQLVAMPNSGCRVMLRDHKIDDLARIYSLFDVKNCRDELKRCMYEYVKEIGEKLVDDQDSDKKPVEFVGELLELQAKFDEIVKKAFAEDKSFQKSIKEAFEYFINKNQRCAQYLSLYLDELLRNKIKASQDPQELNLCVDRIVVLFRHLHDKDIFENFYKQQLAKRLLSGRSVSDDAESSVIKKLKRECGHMFTSKLEGMFKDIRLSKEAMEKFLSAHPRDPEDTSPELNVTVLTAGFWPTEGGRSCTLPDEIKPCCDQFASHYLDCHSGRRLTWQTNLGTADMKVRFTESVTHEFNVSTYQMCILLLFNSRTELTFQEIHDHIGVETRELKRHLISLAAPKFRILTKNPKGRVINPDTKFQVNKDFKSKHYRIRVPLVSTRENIGGSGSKGAGAVPLQVEEDRKHSIEAALVRVAKARKKISHQLLVAEVTKQMASRFTPSPQDIKRRIESLLEREYLERGEDRKTYIYLA